jgi:hypothetical protein
MENWRLGGWQGYQDTNFEAIIDLGSLKPISRLAAGFLQDTRSWIVMPTKVEFWLSDDGVNYSHAATVNHSIPADNMDIVIQDLEAKVNTNGRYVKVVAHNFGALPQWHLGAGSPAFIFVDEVMVE